jgi:hypothetical protein
MYPLNVQMAGPKVAFAVASNEAEHAALTAAGYLPALVVAEEQEAAEEVAAVQPEKRGPGRPRKQP